MSRQVTWARRVRRAAPSVFLPKMPARLNLSLDQLGIEMVQGPALYDNGTFFVVDTIPDLEYAVVGPDYTCHRTVPLDLDEAKRVADDALRAWQGIKQEATT